MSRQLTVLIGLCASVVSAPGQSNAFYRVVSATNTAIQQIGRDGSFIVSNANRFGSFTIESTATLGSGAQWKTVAVGTNTNRSLLSVSVPLGPWNERFQRRTNLFLGGVVCDYLAKQTWDRFWKQDHPLRLLKTNGLEWVRVGVLTTSSSYLSNTPPAQWPTLPWRGEYWSSLEYAGEILREAAGHGLRLNLFFFLSEQPAFGGGQQQAPPAWAGLSVADTASVLSNYTYTTTLYFQNRGLNIELYDIGNEIELGILNFLPDQRIYRPPDVDILNDMNYMTNNVWNIEATLLKAAIGGVKRANPAARTVLHVAGLGISPGDVFVKTFFATMVSHGVPYDYAGLSHPYPQNGWFLENQPLGPWLQRLRNVVDFLAGLNKPVIISEGAYPKDTPGISGGALRDYPYTPAGQAAWLRDVLRFCGSTTNIAGFHYFYPDYFPGMTPPGNVENLQSSGLFSGDSQPAPALLEYQVNRGP
jgi:arabinogalactan endo-1,4-beta-galactosidase